MTRRELRENTFKMLFRKDFYEESELEEQFALFADSFENPMTEKDRMYIHDRTAEIFSKIEVSEGWKTGRMSKVDLTIMRLAYYEMKIDDDIPVSVAINEAVELAKKFGGDDSPSFVNGILAKLTD